MNHRWQIGHRFRTPSTRRRQSSLGGRNCGKYALETIIATDAALFSGFWAYFLATSAIILHCSTVFPQLRPKD
jgi:hypothetical protein